MTIRQKSIAIFTAVFLTALYIVMLMPQAALASTFTGLGYLEDTSVYSSRAYGISSDGSIVVGSSKESNKAVSVMWTADGGLENLGTLKAIKKYSYARGVSADGSRVVGYTNTSYGYTAYLWSEATGMVSLGDLRWGAYRSMAYDISADGSVVVGYGNSEYGTEAFIWTEENGMVGLGDLEGGDYYSSASAVSADGSVVVGTGRSENGIEGFIWTEAAGMIGLGTLDDENFRSMAEDISADGSTVVGHSDVGSIRHSFIWTEETGMVDIGYLDSNTYAQAVSGDGSIVVGYNRDSAFVWTEDLGMFYLYDFLVELGVEGLDGWTLDEAYAISDDGLVIVGEGTNPDGITEAWKVSLDTGSFSAVPVPGAIWLLGSGMIALAGFRRRSGKLKNLHITDSAL